MEILANFPGAVKISSNAIYLCMTYSIRGHISYILETNSKRPIREK